MDNLTTDLLGREWQRDDGAARKIERCLIDANRGHSTDVVYQFCRQSPHASILLPSHGRFVGACPRIRSANTNAALVIALASTGESPRSTASEPFATLSTTQTGGNHSRTHASPSQWATEAASPFRRNRAEQHRMFAEQITAEYFIRTEGRGRTVDEWKARPEQPDNHWLDCLVGCAVAASMQGALLFGTDRPAMPNRDRVSFQGLERNKRG